MSSLQISPIGGVTAPSGASPAGEAESSPNSPSKPNSAKSAEAKPSPTAASVASQAAKATAAIQADAQQAAQAASARTDLRVETPPLNLSVGLIGGTFDVYVDLTDPVDNRVVARLYGPKGGTPAPPQPVPTKVHTEA